MLSTFPQLLFLAPLAAALVRLALAIAFGYTAWRHVRTPETLLRISGAAEAAVGLALLLGAWTQPIALLGAVLVVIALLSPRTRTLPRSTLALALVMCATLVITGAGAFAIDLPL
ncbi:MAG: hypothetical protein U1D26_01950 [Patescibacteria group bacterium]|nr:hypothetical protein [bacterium]MDZ4227219.1 hypothetical protein [Patescibacteria group bacterium]